MPTLLVNNAVVPQNSSGPDLLVSANDVRVGTGSLEYVDSGATKTVQNGALRVAREVSWSPGSAARVYLKQDGSDAVVTENPDAELGDGTWIYLGRVWKLADGNRIVCVGKRGAVPQNPSIKQAIFYTVPSNPNLSGVVVRGTSSDWHAPGHPFQNSFGDVHYTLRITVKDAPCSLRRQSDGSPLASAAAGEIITELVITGDGDMWEFKNPGGSVTIICQEALEPLG